MNSAISTLVRSIARSMTGSEELAAATRSSAECMLRSILIARSTHKRTAQSWGISLRSYRDHLLTRPGCPIMTPIRVQVEWNPCSVTCGYGETMRWRSVFLCCLFRFLRGDVSKEKSLKTGFGKDHKRGRIRKIFMLIYVDTTATSQRKQLAAG